MAYNKERAANIATKDVALLPAGINEDVKLISARTAVSINGNRFLEIVFGKDGRTVTHTEWKPVFSNFVNTEDKLQERMDKQYSRMLQILRCFYNEEALNFNGESFDDFANWVTNMLENADKNKRLRLKVVFNDRGYTTLPNYCQYTFIEPMEMKDGETSKIAQLSIDRFIRPIQPDKEQANNNPFDTVDTFSATVNDDLPF